MKVAVVVLVLACAVASAVAEPPAIGAKLVQPIIFGAGNTYVNLAGEGPMPGRPRANVVVSPRPSAPVVPAVPVPAPAHATVPGALVPGAAPSIVVAPASGMGSRGEHPTPGFPVAPLVRRLGADYGDNKCIRQGGQCQRTDTCGGIITKGICPGPSYITCCTYTSTACAAVKGSCKDTSTCTGTVVRGLCPGGNNIACCTERLDKNGQIMASSAVPAKALGGNCLANFNGAALAARASQYQLAYRAHGVRRDEKRRQFGAAPPVMFADAASFVTSVLDSLSWNCLFATGKHVAAMLPQMRVRGGFHAAPKLGDVVMWSAHAGIVTEVCANGDARIVAMGEHGAQDSGCVSLAHLKEWGTGEYFGFWTPL